MSLYAFVARWESALAKLAAVGPAAAFVFGRCSSLFSNEVVAHVFGGRLLSHNSSPPVRGHADGLPLVSSAAMDKPKCFRLRRFRFCLVLLHSSLGAAADGDACA